MNNGLVAHIADAAETETRIKTTVNAIKIVVASLCTLVFISSSFRILPLVRPVRTANVGRALFVTADGDCHGIRVGLSSPDHACAPDDAEATVRTCAPADRIAPKDRLPSHIGTPDDRGAPHNRTTPHD